MPLAFVLDQLEDPDAFIRGVRELYGHPDRESFDILRFKDGRVFERYSTPQRIDEQIVGRWAQCDALSRAISFVANSKAQNSYRRGAVWNSPVGTARSLSNGVVSKPSPYSVDETIRHLDEVVRSKGLTFFARVDHRAGAREVGLDMQDEQVLIFGNPRSGTPLMVARPLVALDLPLRVLVWRESDGRVWVSYQDSAFIAKRFGLPDGLEKNIAGVPALVDAALR